MRLLIIIPALFSIALLSCKASRESVSTKDPIESVSTPLAGQKWFLTKIHRAPEKSPLKQKAFIKFDTTKGSAGGNGSCNNFGSNMNLDGQKMTIKNIFSTKMYCEEVQQTENAFLDAIGMVSRYEIKADTLFLYGQEDLLLEFVAEKPAVS